MLCKNRRKNRIFFTITFFVIVFTLAICLNIPFSKISNFSNSYFLTQSELLELSSDNYFGPFISAKVKANVVNALNRDIFDSYEPEIEFKLFNLIPIKSKRVKILRSNKIFASGSAVGLVLKTDGVLIVGSSLVSTLDGEKDALNDGVLKLGDTIVQIENENVENVSSISKIINEEKNKDRELDIKIIRKNKEISTKIKPIFDINDNDYKLGVWVRDDASGVGTLTFIDENNRFGALGHPICDSDTKSNISLKEGKVYKCSVLGVNKGISGSPGEIKGFFVQGKDEQGIVEKNNSYGIFGNINQDNSLICDAIETEIGGRMSVKPGKAQIRCCVEGNKVEMFDIEIIKTNYQTYSNDKSMVIRVTDKRLLDKTGGIVQGMSGSPIIQNNKIVGAVTHVFVSDPTKGFGVYIDWMLDQ